MGSKLEEGKLIILAMNLFMDTPLYEEVLGFKTFKWGGFKDGFLRKRENDAESDLVEKATYLLGYKNGQRVRGEYEKSLRELV